jgi:hypothetical protein
MIDSAMIWISERLPHASIAGQPMHMSNMDAQNLTPRPDRVYVAA